MAKKQSKPTRPRKPKTSTPKRPNDTGPVWDTILVYSELGCHRYQYRGPESDAVYEALRPFEASLEIRGYHDGPDHVREDWELTQTKATRDVLSWIEHLTKTARRWKL